LIETLPRLALGNNKVLKGRFVAMAHAKIVAALVRCKLERRVSSNGSWWLRGRGVCGRKGRR
jgi:hypothetical protein